MALIQVLSLGDLLELIPVNGHRGDGRWVRLVRVFRPRDRRNVVLHQPDLSYLVVLAAVCVHIIHASETCSRLLAANGQAAALGLEARVKRRVLEDLVGHTLHSLASPLMTDSV